MSALDQPISWMANGVATCSQRSCHWLDDDGAGDGDGDDGDAGADVVVMVMVVLMS